MRFLEIVKKKEMCQEVGVEVERLTKSMVLQKFGPVDGEAMWTAREHEAMECPEYGNLLTIEMPTKLYAEITGNSNFNKFN